MLKSIIVRELRSLLRQRTIVIAGIILAVMMALAFVVARHSNSQLHKEISSVNNLFRQQWEQLTTGNTHGAAHYGTWLFKPTSTLHFFDRGVTDFTGSAYRIEAHKQHDLLTQTAPFTATYLRFGTITMAAILQLLMPLLLIFLLFDIHTSERNAGTLHLLYVQGAGRKNIIAGKAMAALLLNMLLLAPAALLILITGDDIQSSVYLIAGYFLYSSFFALLSVCISVACRSSRQSLLSLLGTWLLLAIVMPRIIAGVYERKHPLPSQFAIQKKIGDAEKYGLNGKEPLILRKKMLEDSLLAAWKVTSIERLPVNAEALWMQALEDHTQRIYEKYIRETDSIVQLQNSYSSYGRWMDPLLAIREWSMSLSGTDIDHQLNFRQQAFAYRNDFIRQLNNKLAETMAGAHSNEIVVTAGFYKNMKPFVYRALSLSQILQQHRMACLSLAVWLLLCLAWLTWLLNKKNIVL